MAKGQTTTTESLIYEDAQKRGLVKLQRDEKSGQFIVSA